MKFSNHPLVFLIGTNLVLWGLAFSVSPIQSVLANLKVRGLDRPQVSLVASPSRSYDSFSSLVSSETSRSLSDLLSRDPLLFDESDADVKPRSRPNKLSTLATETTSSRLRRSYAPDQKVLSTPVANHTETFFTQLAKADGLGSEVTKKNQSDPSMPVSARAESLQQEKSTDVLSALPLHWRQPLRQELAKRPTVSKVAMVRIPVQELSEAQEVPVIIDDKGQVEGLTTPKSSKVRAAVEKWMNRQKPSQNGTVSVMVVSAEPFQVKPSAADTLVSLSPSLSSDSPQAVTPAPSGEILVPSGQVVP